MAGVLVAAAVMLGVFFGHSSEPVPGGQQPELRRTRVDWPEFMRQPSAEEEGQAQAPSSRGTAPFVDGLVVPLGQGVGAAVPS